MKRIAFLFLVAAAFAAPASAQTYPRYYPPAPTSNIPPFKASVDFGPVLTMGSDELGSATSNKVVTPLSLSQGAAPSVGWNFGYVPAGRWGFQVRGTHFGTSADLHGSADDMTMWNTNPRTSLFCSAVLSVCASDVVRHNLSETLSRHRLDFLAVHTNYNETFSYFGGLTYLGQTSVLHQDGNWPDNIYDKVSGVATKEIVAISTDNSVQTHRVGVAGGVEIETCINRDHQIIVGGRAQLSAFPGGGQGSGNWVYDKTGTRSNGTSQNPIHQEKGFNGSVSGTSLEANLEGSIGKFWESTGLLFVANYIHAGNEPDLAFYTISGQATQFGNWTAGTRSANYLRLAARFTLRLKGF